MPRHALGILTNGAGPGVALPHYYDREQEAPSRPFRIRVRARGRSLSLWSDAGVFSKDRLDAGTALLLDACELLPGWRVHDLGCGTGVVGVVVKLAEPSCAVLCSDVSERAVALARRNAAERGLDVNVRESDGYAHIPESFDTVLLNPPYVAGRALIYRLIDEANLHLLPGGALQLVARHAKGGEMLKKKMLEAFGNCDDSRRRGGYRVYLSRKE